MFSIHTERVADVEDPRITLGVEMTIAFDGQQQKENCSLRLLFVCLQKEKETATCSSLVY